MFSSKLRRQETEFKSQEIAFIYSPHSPTPQFIIHHSSFPICPMIDRATVEKIAHLARLEINSSEEEQFAAQLSGILDYFEQLSELDTENVPPTTRAIEIQNITRADSNRLYRDHEVLVQESPAPEGDYFRVPRILNTDEE